MINERILKMLKDKLKITDEKQRLAMIVIVASLVSLLLGIAVRTPIFETFSLGSWGGFISFLLSLGTVSDSGKNEWARIAFWISFAAMCVSIFLSTTI